MIVLGNVLKIWIELMKSRNDNAMEKFYRLRTFQKLVFLVEISKISKKIRKNDNSLEGTAPALRVIRAGTRLTVHRSLPYENHNAVMRPVIFQQNRRFRKVKNL